MEMLDIGIVALSLAVLAGVIGRAIQKKRTRETPTVILVKRRHELMTQLQNLAGDRFAASLLAQAEAQRLNAPASSLEVLEAAVSRATSGTRTSSTAK